MMYTTTVNKDELLQVLPPYQGNIRMVEKRQDVYDIIREIERKHKVTAPQYDMICRRFWAGTPESTAANLFVFLKKNTRYGIEPTYKQTVKSPAAILEEGDRYGNDCKHYASFIVGVCEGLKRAGYPIECVYRFAACDPNKPRTIGHVFAVVKLPHRELWVDPVMNRLDQREYMDSSLRRRPVYFYKIDKTPPVGMYSNASINGLYDINGLPNDAAFSGIGKHHHFLDDLNPARRIKELSPRYMRTHPGQTALNFLTGGVAGTPAPASANTPVTLPAPAPVATTSVAPVKPVHFLDAPRIQQYHHAHHRYHPSEIIVLEGIGKKHKKAATQKKKHKIKLKIKAPHISVKPLKKLFLKVTDVAARNAFLLLVELDVAGLASKIWEKAAHDTHSSAWQKLSSRWANNLGGNTNALMKAIKKGVAKYNKKHPNAKLSGMGYLGYIGIGDASDDSSDDDTDDSSDDSGSDNSQQSSAAAAAAKDAKKAKIAAAIAAPIVAVLKDVLAGFGIPIGAIAKPAQQGAEQLATQHNSKKHRAHDDGSATHDDGTNTSVTDNDDGTQTMTVSNAPGISDTEDAGSDSGDDSSGDDTSDDSSDSSTAHHGGGGGGGGAMAILTEAKDFIIEHKNYFIIGGAVVVGFIVIDKVFLKKKKRRR